MNRNPVSAFKALVGLMAIALLVACGGGKQPTIPGVGIEVPLSQVDGMALPTTIASGASDQTVVVSGKATLGEAIASGRYAITLRHSVGATADTSTASGYVVFAWTESTVSANIDLGGGLGTHTFIFAR